MHPIFRTRVGVVGVARAYGHAIFLVTAHTKIYFSSRHQHDECISQVAAAAAAIVVILAVK